MLAMLPRKIVEIGGTDRAYIELYVKSATTLCISYEKIINIDLFVVVGSIPGHHWALTQSGAMRR